MNVLEFVIIFLSIGCVVGIALTIRHGRKQIEREKREKSEQKKS